MIAYLESPIHLSDSLLLPETPHRGSAAPAICFLWGEYYGSLSRHQPENEVCEYSSTTGQLQIDLSLFLFPRKVLTSE